MNVGKSSQLEKHRFGSLHNITWVCYDTEDFLLRHGPRFTNEVACISLNSLLQDERSAICSSEVVLFETLFTFITYIFHSCHTFVITTHYSYYRKSLSHRSAKYQGGCPQPIWWNIHVFTNYILLPPSQGIGSLSRRWINYVYFCRRIF